MHLDLCFHFHAYQPGDVILRKQGDPRNPPEFAERRSPVKLRMGDEDIRGENWTDAMLRFYGAIWKLFREVARNEGAGCRQQGAGTGMTGAPVSATAPCTLPPAPSHPAPFCSVDIEPWTLQLLAQRQPNSFWAFRELVRSGAVDPVATVPFHVLLPHAEPEEQRFLSRLTFRLHGAVMDRANGNGGPLGLWFPETLYSERAGRSVVRSFLESDLRTTADGGRRRLFFILDGNQFLGLDYPQKAMSANFVMIDTERVPVFGRDRAMSDRWAFRQGTIPEMVADITAERTDPVKEEKGIHYALTLASDLESLAGSAEQGARFLELQDGLARSGIGMMSHSAFLDRKLNKEFRSWEGELETKAFMVRLRDFSSWSDFMDQGVDYSSDTRWTGLRRWDGLVMSRTLWGRRISQVWKQGYAKMQAHAARVVRMGAYEAVARCMPAGDAFNPAETEEFLLEYSNLVFAPLLLAAGGDAHLDFHRVLERRLPGCRMDEEAALAARAYYEMLMSSRSCPRFWENIDTRVTFQAVAFAAHALLDIAEVCGRLGLVDRAAEAERLFTANLLDFQEAYRYYQLSGLFGAFGWEVSEDAWYMAIQSEIPQRSTYNVVKRAALFVASREGTGPARRVLAAEPFDPAQVVADTGQIEGESHGKWESSKYCENRNLI